MQERFSLPIQSLRKSGQGHCTCFSTNSSSLPRPMGHFCQSTQDLSKTWTRGCSIHSGWTSPPKTSKIWSYTMGLFQWWRFLSLYHQEGREGLRREQDQALGGNCQNLFKPLKAITLLTVSLGHYCVGPAFWETVQSPFYHRRCWKLKHTFLENLKIHA